MYIRKRGQFYHYEFFVNGNRYAGSFNGKNDAKTAANKKEACEFAYLIEKTKNGKPRTIPMSQRVAAILKRLCEDETTVEYIFTSDKTGSRFIDTKKAFTSACREAKITNLTFHDLRHTWASRAAEMGVSEHVRRDILGHSATSMTGDYTHASTEEMERAMELVASYKRAQIFNR
jgi:integrase